MKVGDTIPLLFQLSGRDTDKYVRAYVTGPDDAAVSGSPFALTHTARGQYVGEVTMPDLAYVRVQYIAFDDALFATPSEADGAGGRTFERTGLTDGNVLVFPLSIVGIVGGNARDEQAQVVIVKGEDKTIPFRLELPDGRPYTLANADTIAARFRKTDKTLLEVTLAGGAITITDDEPKLGAGYVELTDAQTALLKEDAAATMELVLEEADRTTIVQFSRLLRILPQLS